MIYSDVEWDSKASISVNEDLLLNKWKTFAIIDISVDNWEQSYDNSKLWKEQ